MCVLLELIGKGRISPSDLPINIIYNSRKHSYSSSSLRKRIYEIEKF